MEYFETHGDIGLGLGLSITLQRGFKFVEHKDLQAIHVIFIKCNSFYQNLIVLYN
jgi:hypothetical protein